MVKRKKTRNNYSKNKLRNEKIFARWHAVPLKGSFMATAMLGFFISAYWVYPKNFNYGIAFMIIFASMFTASVISMTEAPIVSEKY